MLTVENEFPVLVALVARPEKADQRHHHVRDKRVHDLSEGGADDDADRQINHVALEGELLEFFKQRKSFLRRLQFRHSSNWVHCYSNSSGATFAWRSCSFSATRSWLFKRLHSASRLESVFCNCSAANVAWVVGGK